jgi:hypothetical protein
MSVKPVADLDRTTITSVITSTKFLLYTEEGRRCVTRPTQTDADSAPLPPFIGARRTAAVE